MWKTVLLVGFASVVLHRAEAQGGAESVPFHGYLPMGNVKAEKPEGDGNPNDIYSHLPLRRPELADDEVVVYPNLFVFEFGQDPEQPNYQVHKAKEIERLAHTKNCKHHHDKHGKHAHDNHHDHHEHPKEASKDAAKSLKPTAPPQTAPPSSHGAPRHPRPNFPSPPSPPRHNSFPGSSPGNFHPHPPPPGAYPPPPGAYPPPKPYPYRPQAAFPPPLPHQG